MTGGLRHSVCTAFSQCDKCAQSHGSSSTGSVRQHYTSHLSSSPVICRQSQPASMGMSERN